MPERLNIGVITKYTEGYYHGALLAGVHQGTKLNNANLFVLNTFMINQFYSDKKKVESYYQLALKHIDGWIILTEGAGMDYINVLVSTGKPVVSIGIYKGECSCTIIKSDNVYGAKEAVEHIISHGHRRIGFIGWKDIDDMVDRYEGYKETLRLNKIPYDPNLVYWADAGTPKEGKKAIELWIKNKIEFSAVFAASDGLAVGTIDGLKNTGLFVPKDIAVVGYDNSSISKSNNPSFTSMDQNIPLLGVTAVETIIDELSNTSHSGRTILIKPSIVKRNSCGCSYVFDDDKKTTREDVIQKNSIIEYLEDNLFKNSDVGTKLLTSNIEGIKKLFPELVDNYSWECVGLWEDESAHSSLKINTIYNLYSKIDHNNNIDIYCEIENFPPQELMPDKNSINSDDVIWIMPISSTTRNWGVMSYISPFNEITTLLKYNISVVLITLLGIAMDRDVAKTELEIALETLKQTQKQLIHSEKMAALGGLVAGIAHEVNTPVGVSVTAASYLDEKNNEIIKLFEDGKLKKGDMEKYINTTMETLKILNINLARASNLVKSFKQIAVDQSMEEKRSFVIKDYISEVLLSLNPKIKKTKHKIIINCDENIKIYTSPGGLSQIITNLIVNSLVHAFEENDEGTMIINVSRKNSEIIIEYSDNGRGINENDIKKIYDPFFTTKRGNGGTGLGLNIVYNIITNEYKGSIKCKSTPGIGTSFTIRIPEKEVIKSDGK
ncbi:MAG TPA: substrate-binding domain-containing protein [Pseudobacteroides sp.]|uniref:substrate-binding domain-containing protein n=1 Tax=Pseudobacteroides sp. TaxID=1968840 RepID=UPI002F9546AE